MLRNGCSFCVLHFAFPAAALANGRGVYDAIANHPERASLTKSKCKMQNGKNVLRAA